MIYKRYIASCYLKLGKSIHVFLALCDDNLNGLTGMDLEEKLIGIAILILLIYYVISKDRVLDKQFPALEKRLQVTLELKVQDFVGQNKADAVILELQHKEKLRL